jgi:RNA polymerase sigma-70 factor (ECF subfamily)
MRRILVDHVRARNAVKGPGHHARLPLDAAMDVGSGPDEDVLALDEALTALARIDSRASEVVELRFFGGLEEREADTCESRSLAAPLTLRAPIAR